MVEDISGADTQADIITEIGGAPEMIPGLKSETWGTQFLNDESGSFVAFSHPSGEDLSVGYLQTIRGLKSETWGTQFLDRL